MLKLLHRLKKKHKFKQDRYFTSWDIDKMSDLTTISISGKQVCDLEIIVHDYSKMFVWLRYEAKSYWSAVFYIDDIIVTKGTFTRHLVAYRLKREIDRIINE